MGAGVGLEGLQVFDQQATQSMNQAEELRVARLPDLAGNNISSAVVPRPELFEGPLVRRDQRATFHAEHDAFRLALWCFRLVTFH